MREILLKNPTVQDLINVLSGFPLSMPIIIETNIQELPIIHIGLSDDNVSLYGMDEQLFKKIKYEQ